MEDAMKTLKIILLSVVWTTPMAMLWVFAMLLPTAAGCTPEMPTWLIPDFSTE